MTSPDQQQQGGSSDRPKFRAGQVVTFRIPDVITGLIAEGHALVLRLLGDVAHLAVLGGGGHLQADVDHIAPAVVGDVPNPLPAPEPAEGSAS